MTDDLSTISRLKTKQAHFPANLDGCLALFVVLIVSCTLLVWVPQLYNNWQLGRFANNLFEYPLPPDTQIISQYAEVGLFGNGNHCDFEVRQVMITKLSKTEIDAYYNSVVFPSVNNHNEGKAPQFQGTSISVSVTFENVVLEGGLQKFAATLFDFGYSPGLDIRCH
jgi:hypothetical protein